MSYISDLPSVPSVLVQCFPLEAYLRNLSTQLSDRLNGLQSAIATVHKDLRSNNDSVRQMKAFLRQQTLLAIREKAAEGGLELPEGFTAETLLPAFLRDEESLVCVASSNDINLAVPLSGFHDGDGDNAAVSLFTLVDQISRERLERCRVEEAEEKRVRAMNAEAHARLERMCADLEGTQRRHMSELERITAWLNPPSDGRDWRDGLRLAEESALQREIHDTLRAAPLFVEFRRLLLCDLTDRLETAQEQQAMSLGSAMVALKDDLHRETAQRKATSAAKSDAAEAEVRGSERRLRELDRSYMPRGEAAAALRDKADGAAVAQKADDAFVRQMEERIDKRLADMDDRMRMYEAERAEFRRILRAVVDIQQSHRQRTAQAREPPQPRGAGPSAPAASDETRGAFLAAENAADPRARRRRDASMDDARSEKGRRLGWRGRGEQETNPGSTLTNTTNSPPSSKGGTGKSRDMREALPLTTNQEAYATYVTSEVNRRVIEQLPPLPYERRQKE